MPRYPTVLAPKHRFALNVTGPGGHGVPLVARQLAEEVVEAERSLHQRRRVPGLQVEARPGGAPGGVPARQPHALTELVADRLAGNPEVPDPLAVEEFMVGAGVLVQELEAQLGRPA